MATESGLDIWRILAVVTAGLTTTGIVGGGRWLLGLHAKQREQDVWRGNVDEKLRNVSSESTGTHEAVLVLANDVKHLTTDVTAFKAEIQEGQKTIQDGQKTILERFTELLSRSG